MILEKGMSDIQISGIATLNNVFEELTGIEEAAETTTTGESELVLKDDKIEKEMDTLKKPLIVKH
jgi:hypothetical protein